MFIARRYRRLSRHAIHLANGAGSEQQKTYPLVSQTESLGSLEKGKEADFTILESDPYNVSPDAIADIKVSETWVAGERKFAA